MKKITFVVLLVFINIILDSCCGSGAGRCFDINSIEIKNFSLIDFSEMTENDTITNDSFAILVNLEAIESMCLNNLNFGSEALAYSCDDIPPDVLANKVQNISIVSDADLSLNFPAGMELKSLFLPESISKSCLENSINLENCFWGYSNNDNTLEEVFNGQFADTEFQADLFSGEIEDFNIFWLKTAEQIIENTHQFTISFEFATTTIEVTTEKIILK